MRNEQFLEMFHLDLCRSSTRSTRKFPLNSAKSTVDRPTGCVKHEVALWMWFCLISFQLSFTFHHLSDDTRCQFRLSNSIWIDSIGFPFRLNHQPFTGKHPCSVIAFNYQTATVAYRINDVSDGELETLPNNHHCVNVNDCRLRGADTRWEC